MKLKTSHAMMLCALALLAAQPVWAAKKGPSANMKVLGTITPGSCSVTVGGQGMFDYGNIAVETITDDEKGTPLQASGVLPLTISCDSLTQVGINLVDMRSDSRVDGLTLRNPVTGVAETSDARVYGLGGGKDHGIGAYTVLVKNPSIGDGDAANFTDIKVDTLKPGPQYVQGHLYNDDLSKRNLLTAWIKAGDTTFTAARLFKADMQLGVTVNKRSALDLSSGVQFDGQATLTVYYF